jgi:ribosomal protein L4
VHCNTCGGQHAYRARAPGTAAGRARPARGNGGRAPAKPTRDYATLLRGRDPSTARAYAVTERFKEGEIIRHPTFGLGVITVLRDGNKIEVMFADGSDKTLIHRR